MKDIQAYIAKIDALIASKQKSSKSDKKGLLAPSKPQSDKKEKQSDLSIVAAYVAAIRNTRQEIKNG